MSYWRRFFAGCLMGAVSSGLFVQSVQAEDILRLATTTSTENSGLLQSLLPPFEQRTGIRIHVIAVGTGKAVRLGRQGDVDAVLVHARAAEDRMIADGAAVNRRDLMVNDFIVVGPPSDPAGIRGQKDVTTALERIAAQSAPFISRGDDSGTHKRERTLWKLAGIQPKGEWYREAGQGMGRVLQMAGELDAYTLTDRGTWLAYQSKSPLTILVEGDSRLANPYGIMAVNPARYPDINYEGAMRLIAWTTSVPGQEIIRKFKIDGQVLFHPLAIPGS